MDIETGKLNIEIGFFICEYPSLLSITILENTDHDIGIFRANIFKFCISIWIRK